MKSIMKKFTIYYPLKTHNNQISHKFIIIKILILIIKIVILIINITKLLTFSNTMYPSKKIWKLEKIKAKNFLFKDLEKNMSKP